MSDPLAFAVDLESVKDRIKALGYFLTVDDVEAASIAIGDENAYPPAAYVSVASERALPNKQIGGFAQRVNPALSILFAEAAADASRARTGKLEQTRKALIRQLIGWVPTGADYPLTYLGYQLRAMSDGLLWGEVTFSTSYRLSI